MEDPFTGKALLSNRRARQSFGCYSSRELYIILCQDWYDMRSTIDLVSASHNGRYAAFL
jgi:hypothetical protein